MTVNEILVGYQRQETRTETPAEFMARWIPEGKTGGADPEKGALLLGFLAGWNAARDGGDMEPPAELLADLLADYAAAFEGR